jgi:hypothetical protein
MSMTYIKISSRLAIDSAFTIGFFKTYIYDRIPQKARPHLPQPRPEPLPPLPPGCRYVHADGDIERAPIGDEPYTIVERKGNFEFVSTAVFRSPKKKSPRKNSPSDYTYQIVKPRLNGDWEITDACTPWWPLPDGREQGFWVLIRLAKGVR